MTITVKAEHLRAAMDVGFEAQTCSLQPQNGEFIAVVSEGAWNRVEVRCPGRADGGDSLLMISSELAELVPLLQGEIVLDLGEGIVQITESFSGDGFTIKGVIAGSDDTVKAYETALRGMFPPDPWEHCVEKVDRAILLDALKRVTIVANDPEALVAVAAGPGYGGFVSLFQADRHRIAALTIPTLGFPSQGKTIANLATTVAGVQAVIDNIEKSGDCGEAVLFSTSKAGGLAQGGGLQALNEIRFFPGDRRIVLKGAAVDNPPKVPDYDRQLALRLGRDDLARAVAKALAISGPGGVVRLARSMDKGVAEMTIETCCPQAEMTLTIECGESDRDFEIYIQAQYLLDGLRGIPSRSLTMVLGGARDPATLIGDFDPESDLSFSYSVMPAIRTEPVGIPQPVLRLLKGKLAHINPTPAE